MTGIEKKEEKKPSLRKESIEESGKKIAGMIRVFKLKKKLQWVKEHVQRKEPAPRDFLHGREEKKLQILIEELDMLRKFNNLGFDSDAINLLLGLYFMVEMIDKEERLSRFLSNAEIPQEEKNAGLELLLKEWWERLQLLPTYDDRTAKNYRHLGTKVVIKKLYSDPRFVEPFNEIITNINGAITKRDIQGVLASVKKAELFCDEIKKMASRPKTRHYTGPSGLEEDKKKNLKIITGKSVSLESTDTREERPGTNTNNR